MKSKTEMIIVGNGIYSYCPVCGQLVKINKFLLGSLHFCLTDDEIKSLNYRLKKHEIEKNDTELP